MTVFAEVAVNSYINDESTGIFDYIIPDEFLSLSALGMRVIVPFAGRMAEGFIVGIKDNTKLSSDKLKQIKDFPDKSCIFDEKQLSLSKWMSEEYMCSIAECLKCIIPPEMAIKENKYIALTGEIKDESLKLKDADRILLDEVLKNGGSISQNELIKILGSKAKRIINRLNKAGMLAIESVMSSNVNEKTVKGIDIIPDKDLIQKRISEFEKSRVNFRQAEILKLLIKMPMPIEEKTLIEDYKMSRSTLNTLIKKGLIKRIDIKVSRDPYKGIKISKIEKPKLSIEQQRVFDKILANFYGQKKRLFLLHGVTGSGKTEVYMRLIEHMIDNGKQAIVLVPEISLTPQTIDWFKGRFERVAVLHSRLSSGERYDEWMRIKNGEVDVVVGARSAVFAPLKNLGIIVIDEEHELSYKSDMTPKYHARDVAAKRCEIEDAMLLLGSATPSIETYYKALNGEYVLCKMDSRIDGRSLPKINIADMRQELEAGNMTIFSRMLYDELKNLLEKKQQAILFLNRRGYSTFVSCRKCGAVMKCKRCDVSLTYHADKNALICHLCGYTEKLPNICPVCKSKYIKHFGIGTQKVENEVKRLFPEARVLRMDLDTTSKKGSHERIYRAFKNHEADILIGTQMVSKGLDFPDVTLVGIIAADLTLNIPDFRSAERTFQLVTQVAGRAGRGRYPGKVIIQTYSPDHYSIMSSMHHDYNEFFKNEISIRKAFGYPPYSDIVNILASSKDEKETINVINDVTQKIKNYAELEKIDAEILGPSPAPISKINTYYRWQTIIKGKIDENLKKFLKSAASQSHIKSSTAKINVDFNPVSLA